MVANGSGYKIEMSVETSLFLATFTSLQTLIGSVANFVIIITIVASRELRRRSEDRLILNLAVADFLALTVFLPMHTYVLSQLYITKRICMFYEFLNATVLATEGYTIFAIGIDTFVAVVFPLRHKELMTNRTTSAMIISSWAIATVGGSVQFFGLPFEVEETVENAWAITYTSIQLLGMPLLYIVIFYYTWKQARAIVNERRNFAVECGHLSNRLALKSAMKTLGLAILYWLTYVPLAVYSAYSWAKELSHGMQMRDHSWIHSFLFLNSCVNPFAYALRTKRFKMALHKNIWSKMFNRTKRSQTSNLRVRYIVNREQNNFFPEIGIEQRQS